jgi:hypothetical protein
LYSLWQQLVFKNYQTKKGWDISKVYLAEEIYVDSWDCGTVVPHPTVKIWDCGTVVPHPTVKIWDCGTVVPRPTVKICGKQEIGETPQGVSPRRLTTPPRQRRHRENDQREFDRMSYLYPEA